MNEMNYLELKQNLNIFQNSEEHDKLIRETDIFKLFLDCLENSDETNAKFLSDNYFVLEDEYNKNIPTNKVVIDKKKYDILFPKKEINDPSPTPFDLCPNLAFKIFNLNLTLGKLRSNFLDEDYLTALEFLYSIEFIKDGFLFKEINDDHVRNKTILDKDARFSFMFNDFLSTLILKNGLTDETRFYFDNEYIILSERFNPNQYFKHINDAEIIESHLKLGIFKDKIDDFLMKTITENREDLTQLFIKYGAKLENISEKTFNDNLRVTVFNNNPANFRNLLKYGADVNGFTSGNSDSIFHMNTKIGGECIKPEDYNEIANIIMKNTKEENMTYNFIRLLSCLNHDDIIKLYDEYFRLNKGEMNISKFILTKDKLSLLNDLDDNFIDFVNNNLELIKKNCDKDALRYIETLI